MCGPPRLTGLGDRHRHGGPGGSRRDVHDIAVERAGGSDLRYLEEHRWRRRHPPRYVRTACTFDGFVLHMCQIERTTVGMASGSSPTAGLFGDRWGPVDRRRVLGVLRTATGRVGLSLPARRVLYISVAAAKIASMSSNTRPTQPMTVSETPSWLSMTGPMSTRLAVTKLLEGDLPGGIMADDVGT